MFITPGVDVCLRVAGTAYLTRDPELLKPLAVLGRVPLVGIGVKVEACFIHCGKAMKRSGLWQEASWPSLEGLPSAGRMLADHTKAGTVQEVEVKLRESYKKRLY